MHATTILHHSLGSQLEQITHAARAKSIMACVEGLTQGKSKLTLTSIGRNMITRAKVKNQVKRVDRLLANAKLHAELLDIQKTFYQNYFGKLERAVLLVDWSGCCSKDRHILQASLVFDGRSIPVYRKVYPESECQSQKAHTEFLFALNEIIPMEQKVIIVTDAGFKNTWFSRVLAHGWDFIGRLRGNLKLQFKGEEDWVSLNQIQNNATTSYTYTGYARLGKNAKFPMMVNVYAHKTRKKNRKKVKSKCQRIYPDAEKSFSTSYNEPWVIATSLHGGTDIADFVLGCYKKRMQIEQNFRDDKNERWGFGLRQSFTKNIERLNVLLLISYLAFLFLWLVGITAEKKKLQYDIQANTIKSHRVLSFIYLAKQVITHCREEIKKNDINSALECFYSDYKDLFIF